VTNPGGGFTNWLDQLVGNNRVDLSKVVNANSAPPALSGSNMNSGGMAGILPSSAITGKTHTDIALRAFADWLRGNYPGISNETIQKMYIDYTKTDRLPFADMEVQRNALIQSSQNNPDSTVGEQGKYPTVMHTPAQNAETHSENLGRQMSSLGGSANAPAPSPTDPTAGGNTGPGIDFPQYTPITIPDLTDTDFTDVAKQRVAAIYAKQYEALDNMLNQAGQQYQQDKPVMAGIYNQLGGDLGNIKQGVTSDLNQTKQEQTARGQDLQNQLANIYAPTASQTAQIAAGNGQDNSQNQAAADTQRQFAQGQAAQGTQTEANYLDNAGSSYQNWLSGTQAAASNEGAAQQSNLLSNYGTIRANLANQRLGIGSNEIAAALGLEQQLSDQDMQKQEWLANMAMQANESQNAANQQNYENQRGAYVDERNFALDAAKQQSAAAAAAAKGAGGSGGAPKSLAAINQQLIADYGDVGLANRAVSTVRDLLGNGVNSVDLASYPAIMARITAVAHQNGDEPNAYQDAVLALITGGGIPVGNLSQDQIATG
jgi:hypothetical protein